MSARKLSRGAVARTQTMFAAAWSRCTVEPLEARRLLAATAIASLSGSSVLAEWSTPHFRGPRHGSQDQYNLHVRTATL